MCTLKNFHFGIGKVIHHPNLSLNKFIRDCLHILMTLWIFRYVLNLVQLGHFFIFLGEGLLPFLRILIFSLRLCFDCFQRVLKLVVARKLLSFAFTMFHLFDVIQFHIRFRKAFLPCTSCKCPLYSSTNFVEEKEKFDGNLRTSDGYLGSNKPEKRRMFFKKS